MEAAGPSGVVVIDSGAGTVRGGYGGERQPRVCMPNCTARLKHQLGVLVGEETADAIKDRSQLTLQRPCDRGYVVNWDAQVPSRNIVLYSFLGDRRR
jgi:actin-related protein